MFSSFYFHVRTAVPAAACTAISAVSRHNRAVHQLDYASASSRCRAHALCIFAELSVCRQACTAISANLRTAYCFP